MNEKIYNLINKVIDSDLPKETRNQIVRFYLLPRLTKVKPQIELPEETKDLGVVKRPGQHELNRRANPEMAQEEDAIKESLKGRIEEQPEVIVKQ